jgi:hypothetical protein
MSRSQTEGRVVLALCLKVMRLLSGFDHVCCLPDLLQESRESAVLQHTPLGLALWTVSDHIVLEVNRL